MEVTGSLAKGLYLPYSDVDLPVLGQRQVPSLHYLLDVLVQHGVAACVPPTALDRAAEPIAKFVFLAPDLSLGIKAAVSAAGLVKEFLEFPCFRPLSVVVRYYLRKRGLVEVFKGACLPKPSL